jgi:hypothetical protein
VVDVVTTEGEKEVLKNLQRKSAAADAMFERLVAEMNHAVSLRKGVSYPNKEVMPAWL